MSSSGRGRCNDSLLSMWHLLLELCRRRVIRHGLMCLGISLTLDKGIVIDDVVLVHSLTSLWVDLRLSHACMDFLFLFTDFLTVKTLADSRS